MRGKRAFLVLTGYVLTLSLIISLIYIVLHKNAPTTVVNQAGSVLTPVLIYVQMGLICLIAPTFSASAISSEREQQTFDLLIASLAQPSTILFGKVGAALSYLFLTLFGSLPLIALTYSLGGVALRDIAIAAFCRTLKTCAYREFGLLLDAMWSTRVVDRVGVGNADHVAYETSNDLSHSD